MNTAISVSATGTREDVTGRVRPVPVPPGATGTAGPAEGGLPGPDTWPDRPAHPCVTATYRGGPGGRRPIARPPAPRRGPAVRPLSGPPEPGDLVERARAGYAATALTAVISAAVVVAFLALAHLRAPEPAPAPVPSGIPGVSVPDPGAGVPGSR